MKSEIPENHSVYFDNAAAAPVSPEILARFVVLASKFHANQEAAGADGLRAACAVNDAALRLRAALCPHAPETRGVLWCASGTDAVRAALETAALVRPNGGDVLYSDAEHASVLAAIRALPGNFRPVKVALCADGRVDTSDFERRLSARTVLASVPFVQSETGVVQDLALLRSIQKQYAPSALFFTDSIQGVGKVPLDLKSADPDFFTLSGQKLGTPGGAALLCRSAYRRHADSLRTSLHRIGRLSPAFAILLAERAEFMIRNLPDHAARVSALNDHVTRGILEILPSAGMLPSSVPRSPWIAHFRLCGPGRVWQGAVVTRLLAERNVSVSAGSACSAETNTPSAVLRAMGFDVKNAFSALRLSFSQDNTMADAELFLDAFRKTIADY